MPADTAATDDASTPDWRTCEADECEADGAYGLQYRVRDADGDVIGNGALYCPYHCAVRERAIRATPGRELARITVFREHFETWTPPHAPILYNIDPERELELLADYLDAQDDSDCHTVQERRRGVEAALEIVRGARDMTSVVQSWPEPWKNPPSRSS